MKTPMLKRRLNPFLLVSTVLILSLLAGLSVLYQGQLDNITSEKQDLSDELQEKSQQIAELEQDKKNLTMHLEDTESERDRYVDLYESEQERRDELEDEVKWLENELDRVEGGGATAQQINDSLSVICTIDEDSLSSTSLSECSEWGH